MRCSKVSAYCTCYSLWILRQKWDREDHRSVQDVSIHIYIHTCTRLFFKWCEGYQGEITVLVDDDRKDWCKHCELSKSLDLHLYKVKKESWAQLIHDHDDYFVL